MTLQVLMSWIGYGIVAIAVVVAVYKMVLSTVRVMRSPTVYQPSLEITEIRDQICKVNAAIQEQAGITRTHLSTINDNLALVRDGLVGGRVERTDQASKQLAALDSLSLSFEKFTRSQTNWLTKILGGDGSGYTDMTDQEAELRERAEGIRRRYGVDWAEAMDRAKKTLVYEPNARMKDQV